MYERFGQIVEDVRKLANRIGFTFPAMPGMVKHRFAWYGHCRRLAEGYGVHSTSHTQAPNDTSSSWARSILLG
jgi:hypothetical protein